MVVTHHFSGYSLELHIGDDVYLAVIRFQCTVSGQRQSVTKLLLIMHNSVVYLWLYCCCFRCARKTSGARRNKMMGSDTFVVLIVTGTALLSAGVLKPEAFCHYCCCWFLMPRVC
jgi:hypothetical protein